jgi:hypothetical protein
LFANPSEIAMIDVSIRFRLTRRDLQILLCLGASLLGVLTQVL